MTSQFEHQNRISPRQVPSSTQKTIPFKAVSAIITPPTRSRTKLNKYKTSVLSTQPFQMTEGKRTSSMANRNAYTCRYCKKVTFPSEVAAKGHEETCVQNQIQMLKSCHSMLENINLNRLGTCDIGDSDFGSDTGNIEHVMNILSRMERYDHIDIVNMKVLNSTKISTSLKTLKRCRHEQIKIKTKTILKKWGKINDNELKKTGETEFNAAREKTKRKDTCVTSNEEIEDDCNHKHHPPMKKQKKTAPIFFTKKDISKESKGSSTTPKDLSRNTKSSRMNRVQGKPLASIFCTKRKISTDESSKLNKPAADDVQTESSLEFLSNNEALLLEHKKAELQLEQRQRNKERQLKKKRNQNDCTDRKNPLLAKIFAVKNEGPPKENSNINKGRCNKRNVMDLMNDRSLTKGSSSNLKSRTNTSSISMPPQKKVHIAVASSNQTKNKEEEQIKARLTYLRRSAPVFPLPSHVFHNEDEKDGSNHIHRNHFDSDIRNQLRCSPKFQQGYVNVIEGKAISDMNGLCQFEISNCDIDPLHAAFSAVLQPSKSYENKISDIDDISNQQLWTDKYAISAIPHDIQGVENKLTAQDLVTFVKEWKEKREEAILAAEEAQRRRTGVTKKKTNSKKKKYEYDDDDFWSDAEDEYGLSKVYILCGPTSSGKSSLVHAVAKKCQCYVLEINTTDDRSGVSLKKTIEESTQSHSSIALLKRKNNFVDQNILQDSDDEEEQKKPSLGIILIDEVDLLFESDVGFWQSLSNVAKKARCPIVLTAPHPPPQIINLIQYRFGYLNKPSPVECASKMCQIAKMENMPWNNKYGPDVRESLSLIAKMCNCDLRRIINEMQLFNNGRATIEGSYEYQTKKERNQPVTSNSFSLEIDSISPKRVPFNSHTILEIRLRDPLENVSSVTVVIGDQPSPATKLTDPKTLQTICPPCSISDNITEFGLIKKIHEPSLDCTYKQIYVQATFTSGKISRSDLPFHSPPLVSYEFPEEFCDDMFENTSIVHKQKHNDLKNAIISLKEVHDHIIDNPDNRNTTDNTTTALYSMLEHVTNASDAALLDDVFHQVTHIPNLAGSVMGCHDSTELESGYHFLGGSDVYMNRPLSHREKSLNLKTCNYSRGLASFNPDVTHHASSINHDIMKSDDFDSCFPNTAYVKSISDEDMFLPQLPSLGAQAAAFIRKSCGTLVVEGTPLNVQDVMDKEKEVRAEEVMHTMVHDLSMGNKLLHCSYLDPPNCSITLDYLPTLRNIAALEEKAEENFEALKANSSDDDNFTTQSRRRSRRRAALVREHYFEKVVFSDKEPKKLGKSFARMKLALK